MAKQYQIGVRFTAQENVSSRLNKINAAVNKTSLRFKRLAKSVKSSLNEMNAAISKKLGGIKNMIPGIGLLSGAGLFMGAKDTIETTANLQAVEQAIRFASVSAKEGAKNVEFLRKTSKDLSIDYLAAAEGYKRFLGSTMGEPLSVDKKREIFTNTSKAIRVLGLDAEQSESVFRALGEIISKGSLQAQELKIQLANAIPGASRDQAAALDMSVKQLFDNMKSGSVDGLTAVVKLTDYWKNKFSKGVKDSVSTPMAALTRISNQILYIKEKIGNSLINAGVLTQIEKIGGKILAWFDANEKLINQKVSEYFDKIVKFGKWVINHGEEIKNMFIWIGLGVAFLKTQALLLNLQAALTTPLGVLLVVAASLAGVYLTLRDNQDKWIESTIKGSKALAELDRDQKNLKNFMDGLFNTDSVQQWNSLIQIALARLEDLADFAIMILPESEMSKKLKAWKKGLRDESNRIDRITYGDKYSEAHKKVMAGVGTSSYVSSYFGGRGLETQEPINYVEKSTYPNEKKETKKETVEVKISVPEGFKASISDSSSFVRTSITNVPSF